MKKKIGVLGKVVRVALVIVVVTLYWTNIITGMVALVVTLVMGVLIIAIFIGFWPLYYPFIESTTKKEEP